MKKRLAAGALITAALISTAAPALAASGDGYPNPTAGVGMVSAHTTSVGQSVLFSGAGFQPGTAINITDNSAVVDSAMASDQGTFVVSATVGYCGPNTLIGDGAGLIDSLAVASTVTGVCAGSATSTMTTERAATFTGGRSTRPVLPATGNNFALPGLTVGFGLVVAGTALTVALRRRRMEAKWHEVDDLSLSAGSLTCRNPSRTVWRSARGSTWSRRSA